MNSTRNNTFGFFGRSQQDRGLHLPSAGRPAALFVMCAMLAPCSVAWAQDAPPDRLELAGVARDFIEQTKEGGHTDFEQKPASGFGHYMGNVSDTLDADSKPVFEGGGHKVAYQWKNSAGQPIHPKFYDPSKGDVAGRVYASVDPGGIESAMSFREWFRDTPGTNLSEPLNLTLERVGGTDEQPVYSFMSDAFFPLDGKLLGNSGGAPDHNFHFTFELHTEFTYLAGSGQVFSFYGDDDVWVYVNDDLVIDIGGVHAKVQQVVELDRLGLEDGKTYPLDFFFAERHRTQSNFRIDTTLVLSNKDLPTVSAAYD
ncbi:MAG: fibro-slime domain-containing protein [Planctomycetes bacterium]|nr:fibro-slime domain-containing protein [Planctomycetota bacterium]NOG52882.1 fibro-slime domain-containing protein [Planctomycetota bacterium]